MVRVGAALCVYYTYHGASESAYGYRHGRKKLAECSSVWNKFRREKSKDLVNQLDTVFPFLGGSETAEAFIGVFDFGQFLQRLKRKFSLPKNSPTRWWKDGHVFPENHMCGIHKDLKEFFDYVSVKFE